MLLQIKDISHIHPDRELLFRNVSMSVGHAEKVALIGDNGSGKSTLLKIMNGSLQPSSGEVLRFTEPYSVPQHFGQYDGLSVAEALGIGKKLQALHSILAGDLSEVNYTALEEDWDVEQRARTALDYWGLPHAGLAQRMDTLSGGEKTKVFLAGIQLHDPALILMDEPTNHLDAASREILYDFIKRSGAAVVIVSHDRRLLNMLDRMNELTAEGITVYGGNYEFYMEQKTAAATALEERVRDKAKSLKEAERTARIAAERKQREDSRGTGRKIREGTPRIMMRTLKNRAQASASRQGDVHDEKIGAIKRELTELRSKAADNPRVRIKMGDSALHTGKKLVRAEGINFGYGAKALWGQPLDFSVFSGDRIVIKGGNGSGKTTLIKLITGQVKPTSGVIERSGFRYLYIDQEYSPVDDNLTVLQQVESYNLRNLPDHILKTELHRFLFPANSWDKLCGRLSGGEKMKLILCCLLVSDAAPDMFILDEPTNNLDIRSLEIVSSSLRDYEGTLLVVSHDEYFLDDIGVDRQIAL